MPWYDAETAVAETMADRFWGATIQLFHVEVLVVLVSMRVIGDRREAPIAVGAFQQRFGRTIVLAAQSRDGRPTYYGPAAIAQVLGQIPFDALAWKRYRLSRPKPLMLPIPTDPPPESRVSWSDLHVVPGRKSRGENTKPGRRPGNTRALDDVPPSARKNEMPRHTRASSDARRIPRSFDMGNRALDEVPHDIRTNETPRRTRGLSESPGIPRPLDLGANPRPFPRSVPNAHESQWDDVPWEVVDSRNKLAFPAVDDGRCVGPELSYLRTAIRDHEHEETRP